MLMWLVVVAYDGRLYSPSRQAILTQWVACEECRSKLGPPVPVSPCRCMCPCLAWLVSGAAFVCCTYGLALMCARLACHIVMPTAIGGSY